MSTRRGIVAALSVIAACAAILGAFWFLTGRSSACERARDDAELGEVAVAIAADESLRHFTEAGDALSEALRRATSEGGRNAAYAAHQRTLSGFEAETLRFAVHQARLDHRAALERVITECHDGRE